MNILITAGNTQTPLDKVRCITNIFTGRTGARVALEARAKGHRVVFLTSHPGVIADLAGAAVPPDSTWCVDPYRTFDDLHTLMERRIRGGGFDAVIHAAAVSDYQLAGAYVAEQGTAFDAHSRQWKADGPPRMAVAIAGKIKSRHDELWLRLVPTMKLVDQIREPWGFKGVLVKFKLEVGVSDQDLLRIAEQSRNQSRADLICANTLEGMNEWAYLGPIDRHFHRIERPHLAGRLMEQVERLHTHSSTGS